MQNAGPATDWSRSLRAEPDDHRCGYEHTRVQDHLMLFRVLACLSLALARACRAVVVPDRQTRAMSRWNNGEEEDVLVDHRTSSPIMSVPTAALISPDDFVNQECRALVRCEHGRMLRHAREPTTSTAATSGRPDGLHTTASHMVAWSAPSDPGERAAQVGGFTFGKWEPHSFNTVTVAHFRCRPRKPVYPRSLGS